MSLATWNFCSGSPYQALAQVWPSPAVLAYTISTGHVSRLESLIDHAFRAQAPFSLHQKSLVELLPEIQHLSQDHFGQPTTGARYVNISALRAYVKQGTLYLEQLGPGFSCYSTDGLILDHFAEGSSFFEDTGEFSHGGDLRFKEVQLPSGSPLFVASDLIAKTVSSAEISQALTSSPRYNVDILPELAATAIARQKLVPFAPIPQWGCAALVWPSTRD